MAGRAVGEGGGQGRMKTAFPTPPHRRVSRESSQLNSRPAEVAREKIQEMREENEGNG